MPSDRHPDRRVEARPAFRFHLPRESGADFMLGQTAARLSERAYWPPPLSD
jgi:hypothetical protein